MSKLRELLKTLPDNRKPEGNWLVIFDGKLTKQFTYKDDIISYIRQSYTMTQIAEEKLMLKLKTTLAVTYRDYTIINAHKLLKAQVQLTLSSEPTAGTYLA